MGDIFSAIGDWLSGGSYSAEEGLKKQVEEQKRVYNELKTKLKVDKDQMITDSKLNIAIRKGLIDQNALDTAKAYNARVSEAVNVVTGGKASNVLELNKLYKDNTDSISNTYEAAELFLTEAATKGIDLLSDAGKQYSLDIKSTLKTATGMVDTTVTNSGTAITNKVNKAVQALEKDKGGYQAYTDLGEQAAKDMTAINAGKYKMEESPAAKYALEQGLKSQSRLQRASGQRVSNMGQSQEAELRSGIAATDYQNKINNISNALNMGLNTVRAKSMLSTDIASKQSDLGKSIADLLYKGGMTGADLTAKAGQMIADNDQSIQKSIFDVKANLATNQFNNTLNEGTLTRSEYDKNTQGILNENNNETNALFGLKQGQQQFDTNLASNQGAQILANTTAGQKELSGITDTFNTNINNLDANKSIQDQGNIGAQAKIEGTRNNMFGNILKPIVAAGANMILPGSGMLINNIGSGAPLDTSGFAPKTNTQQVTNQSTGSMFQQPAFNFSQPPIGYGQGGSQAIAGKVDNSLFATPAPAGGKNILSPTGSADLDTKISDLLSGRKPNDKQKKSLIDLIRTWG